MPKNILILTATISPPADAPGVVRLDPLLRIQDYISALDYYMNFTDVIDEIVFVDNSGYSLDAIETRFSKQIFDRRLLVVQTFGNDFPPDYGRCFGEMMILDYVMSSKTNSWDRDTVFWKITGRYKLINFRKVIQTRPSDVDLYMDLRLTRRSRWADMRVFSWTKAGYDSILLGNSSKLREDLRERRPGEEAAYDLVSNREKDESITVCNCFATEPKLDGVRAFDNKNWNAGRQRFVALIRQMQRSIFRKVWF